MKIILIASLILNLSFQETYCFDSFQTRSKITASDEFQNEDTLRALIHLKKRTNKTSKIFIALGTVGLAVSLVEVNSDSENGKSTGYKILTSVSSGAIAVGLFFLIKNNKFFNRKIEDYRNGIPLPAGIKRALKKEDFIY